MRVFRRNIVFACTCLLLAFIPLPYGGIEEWAIFAFEATVFLAAFLQVSGAAAAIAERGADGDGGGERDAFAAERLPKPLKALLAIFFILALGQIIPMPRGIVEFLSPRIHEIKGDGAWISLSIAPSLTLYELLKYAAYVLFGHLVYVQAGSKKKITVIVFVMLASGLFQSLYGMAEYFSGSHTIFGWINVYNQKSAFGTFVNRNHYSAFLEMTLALSIGYLLARADFFSMKPGQSRREKIGWFGQERLQKTVIAGLVPVLLGVGIIFSWSRSGAFVFLAVLLTMTILIISAGRRGPADGAGMEAWAAGGRGRPRRLIRAVFAGVAGIVLLLGISPLLERLSSKKVLGENRPLYFKYTADVIRAFPLAGTGLGCFLYGYNMFEAEYTPGQTTHAHNDYLEVLAESGLPAALALFAAAFGALAVMAVRWSRRRDNFVCGLVLGAIAGIAAVLIHSFTDFSLRMPANAAYAIALYALGYRMLRLRDPWFPKTEAAAAARRAPAPDGRRAVRAKKLAGTAGLMFLLALAVKENMGYVCLARYDAARAGLADKGRSLMSGFSELDRLVTQAAWWSENPRFSEEQGRLYVEMAVAENESGAPARRDAFLGRAETATRRRIRQNPADAMAYYEMSRIFFLFNYPLLTYQDEALRYLRQALIYKPDDLFLNVEAVYKYCVLWDALAPAEKKWMFARMRSVWKVNGELFYPRLVDRWRREVGNPERLKGILGLDPEVWRRAAQFFRCW